MTEHIKPEYLLWVVEMMKNLFFHLLKVNTSI